jgi:Xaa-Pro aminopeptidase
MYVRSDKTHMSYGAMAVSLGGRYQYYCANVCRTFMLVPSKQLEDVYQALLDAQQAVVDTLRPGNTYAQAYAAGLAVFEERQPTLVDKLTKSFGLGAALIYTHNARSFVTGIMFRDNALLISPKCTEKIVEHTTIVVHMGVADVPNPTAKDKLDRSVGLLVSDTYLVTRVSGSAYMRTRIYRTHANV